MSQESIQGKRSSGEGIGYVLRDSASRPGLKHRVAVDGSRCSCEAGRHGSFCSHKRLQRAERRAQDGTYHRVSEKHGIYGPYYVVIDSEGSPVTGPTLSKLEALGWAAEEDVAVVVPVVAV